MTDNITWLKLMIATASTEGNFEDFTNYSKMLKHEQERGEESPKPTGGENGN